MNTRLAFGTTLAGGHRSTAATISAHLGLPPPVAFSEWTKDVERLGKITKELASKSMDQAAREAASMSNMSDITVSCDGTWQRRGFSSKNGVATVITHSAGKPGKVVDTEVLSNYCFTCASHKDSIPPEHSCVKNHEGSG